MTPSARISASLLAIVVTAAGAPAAAAGASVGRATGNASREASDVGVFTGTFVNGMPLYRFPPITVTAHRKEGLARMSEEAQRDHIREVHAKSAVKREHS